MTEQQILYKMARLLRNTDGLDPGTYGARAWRLLLELRKLDQAKYDAEVMAVKPLTEEVQ